MGDNELWEDDPKGYDGWLQPHEEEQDKGDPAIRYYDRSKNWWFFAKLSLVTFVISFLFCINLEHLPTEQSFFHLVMLLSLVLFAVSASISALADIGFEREMRCLFSPNDDRSDD